MSSEHDKIHVRDKILCAKNHYEVMSLAKDCGEEDVKKRHRELVRMVHPDKLQLATEAENQKTQQAFRAVQVAYETLSVPHKRKSYDLQLTMSCGGSRFVPGESTSTEDGDECDAGPALATVLLMLMQIMLAVTVYLANDALQDVLNISAPKSRALILCIFSFCVLVFGLECGFFFSWALSATVYAIHSLLGLRKLMVSMGILLILQAHNWNKQGGIPFWLGCTILLQQLVSGASLMAASIAAVMAGLTALLAHFMPQWTLGEPFALYTAAALASCAASLLSLDVFFALFVAYASWHLLQGLPSACLGVMGCSVMYLVYAMSPSMCVVVLALASLAVGSTYPFLLIITSISTLLLAYYSWGLYGAFYLAGVTWGLRCTLEGRAGGKRLAASVALMFCLNCGWISGTLILLIIFFVGQFLKVALELDAAEEGSGNSRSSSSPSQGGGGGGGGTPPSAGTKKKDKAKRK